METGAATVELARDGHCPPEEALGALAAAGVRWSADGEACLRDTYLDTADWWLHRAGALCRLRSEGLTTALQIVPLRPDAEMPAEPPCMDEALLPPATDGMRGLPGTRVRDWLGPCMGGVAVEARFSLRLRRFDYRLARGEVKLLLTLTHVAPEGTGIGLTVVTVRGLGEEPVPAAIRKGLVRDAGFRDANGGFFGECLHAAGQTPPVFAEGDALTLRRDDRFVDFAYRVMARHLEHMTWNEPGTRLGLDAEYLHDMRVAARRLREALRVFKGALPLRRVQALRRDLRWLGGLLGRVRDLDVNLLHLSEETRKLAPELRPGMEVYGNVLAEQRARARAAMLRALGTRRYAAFVDQFRRFLQAGPPARPSAPTAALPGPGAASARVRHRLERVLRDGRAIGPDSADAALHRLRIDCKRLRYSCEFFADLFGKPAVEFALRVTELQDVLGAHQDAVVARQALTEFASGASASRDRIRRLCTALGYLMAWHEERAQTTRREFERLWHRFDRKRTRKALKARLTRS